MPIAQGKVEYHIGLNPVSGCGLSYTDADLDSALSDNVLNTVFDQAGKNSIQKMLHSLSLTGFEQHALHGILEQDKSPEDWRVGEGLAECYLTEYRQCIFPWPDSRDERKSGSSLPGADLVGFQLRGDDVVFAFGEVKTSSEAKYPPGAMYGRTGLKQQLEDLVLDENIKDDLFRYLAHRSPNQNWLKYFQKAACNFLNDKSKIQIFGFLVRDVAPNEDDVKTRVSKLTAIPNQQNTVVELLALYLPCGCINQLSSKIMQYKNGGVA